nr:cory-CC-star protein [Alloalcanivorax mobilis]
MSAPRIVGKLKHWYQRAGDLGAEYYNAPYRAAIARARRDEDDLLMLMVFAESLGIPNPASWYTLELQPLLMDRFHEWHRRMGMPHSPLDQFRCC